MNHTSAWYRRRCGYGAHVVPVEQERVLDRRFGTWNAGGPWQRGLRTRIRYVQSLIGVGASMLSAQLVGVAERLLNDWSCRKEEIGRPVHGVGKLGFEPLSDLPGTLTSDPGDPSLDVLVNPYLKVAHVECLAHEEGDVELD